jgi:hypothetical protein
MSRRRALILAFAATILGIVAIALISPVSTMLYFTVVEENFPDRISWDGKTAWKRCDSAIAGRTTWPPSPQQACAAMHMCVNEAVLSGDQKRSLQQEISAIPGCIAR